MNMKEKMYFELRKEILEKSKKIDNLSTLCLTFMSTIFAIAFNDISILGELVLLPILIIIALSLKVYITRFEIAKISEFIINKGLDSDIGWEQFNSNLVKEKNQEFKTYRLLISIKNCEYFIYVVICVLLYFVPMIQTNGLIGIKDSILSVIISVLAILTELFITFKISDMKKMRNGFQDKKHENQFKRFLSTNENTIEDVIDENSVVPQKEEERELL